jgi:hypothetical protein
VSLRGHPQFDAGPCGYIPLYNEKEDVVSTSSEKPSEDYDPDGDPDMVESTTHQPDQAEGEDDSDIGKPAK